MEDIKMRKRKTLLLLLVSVAVLLSSCAGGTYVQKSPETVYDLTVLHTNDHHGHVLKFYDYPAPDNGGLPARATYVKQVRQEVPNLLVLDAGDVNTGMPESNFFNAEPDFIGYSYIGYDAMTLGNHEFDNPKEVLAAQMEESNFPFLSANIKDANGKLIATPYIIKEYDGFKVAIFGLTTKETATIGNPQIVADLTFEDEVETAKALVPELKKKADIVIALVHMGIYDDGREGLGSRWLARNVDGIDMIIDGHSHTFLEKPMVENGTYIVSAKQWGLYVGRADIKIQNMKIVDFSWKPVPINLKTREKKADGSSVFHYVDKEIPEDAQLLAMLTPYADKVEAALAEEIGTAADVFPNETVRQEETALGDLVADSMKWYAEKMNLDVDFAINNGGGIRETLPTGTITKKTIYQILPFDNSVYVITMKGSDLKGLFDYIPTVVGAGAYPQVSDGISYTIDLAAGEVKDLLIGGKPLDPNATYKIATNSYMATGGDGYVVFKNASQGYDTSMFQRDATIEYIQQLDGAIVPEIAGRVKIIK
jgi:5'-nucleotidase/UDP-sugar diphosphatase